MPTIAIVSCRIFEDEIVRILENETTADPGIQIFLAGTPKETTLPEKLTRRKIRYTIFEEPAPHPDREDDENGPPPEAGHTPAASPAASPTASPGSGKDGKHTPNLTIIIHLIPFSMEAHPPKIRQTVYEHVSRCVWTADGVLVMYGLCGNVLGSIEQDLSTAACPVRILRDDDGSIVDDCICASVGGSRKFIEMASGKGRGVGIYFLTPMQAVHWKEIVVLSGLTPDPGDRDMTKMVFEYAGYKYAGKIHTGLTYEPEWEQKADEFAQWIGLEVTDYEGSSSIAEKSYARLKEIVMKKNH